MAISFVAAASGGRSEPYPAACQTGDLIVCLAQKIATTALTVPTEWTELGTINTDGLRSTLCWRTFTSGDTAPTWATGTGLTYLVYRGHNSSDGIGDFGSASGTSTTVSFPARTLQNTSGSSWVAGMMAIENIDSDETIAPSGMTHRAGITGTNQTAAAHDTNGGVSSWSAQTAAVGGTSTGWHGWTVEILSGANAYTITADAGTVAITGVAATPFVGRRVTADAGAVAVAGTAATLTHASPNKVIVADAGAVTITGTAATVTAGRRVTSDVGAIALTGTDATLKAGRRVTSDAGAVALTGTAAALLYGYRITAAAGAIALTGTDGQLEWRVIFHTVLSAVDIAEESETELVYDANEPEPAEPGAVAITGTAATLTRGHPLAAAAGAVDVTGTANQLEWRVVFHTVLSTVDIADDEETKLTYTQVQPELDPGAVAIAGTAANVVHGLSIVCAAGSVSVIGTAAGVVYGRNIAAAAGAVTIAGTAATLTQGAPLAADPGAIVIAGSDAALFYEPGSAHINAESGAVTITGTAATFPRTTVVTAGAGTVDITGTAAGLAFGRVLGAAAGTVDIIGIDAILPRAFTLTAVGGTVTVNGTAATFKQTRVLIAANGNVLITGTGAQLGDNDDSSHYIPISRRRGR